MSFFMFRRKKKAPATPEVSKRTMHQFDSCGDFAVITCHFNWAGFNRPAQNALRFCRMMKMLGIPVYGVEAVLGEQQPKFDKDKNWLVVKAKEKHIMFQKERMLNMAERLVPSHFTKLAWVDADVMFSNQDWHKLTSVLLDHFLFVQPFEMSSWTDVDGREIFRKPSTLRMRGGLPALSHPGFAMAARRSLWTDHGGLFDRLIVGNGDMGIASAILGCEVPPTQKYSKALMDFYLPWYNGIKESAKTDGYAFTRGVLYHEWHGSIADRQYLKRNEALMKLDPQKHLSIDNNGLLAWTDKAPQDLVSYVKDYFMSRKEDGGGAVSDATLFGAQVIKNKQPQYGYGTATS